MNQTTQTNSSQCTAPLTVLYVSTQRTPLFKSGIFKEHGVH